MTVFSARLDAALAMASHAHAGQTRKGTEIPYVAHPVHVALMVLQAGATEDMVIAALLHDTLEDTAVERSEIARVFGPHVLDLVASMTQRSPEETGLTWRQVKEEALRHLEAGGAELLLIKSADTLHNSASLLMDVRARGKDAFTRFKRDPQDQLWFYGEVARICSERLGHDHAVASELLETVTNLRKELKALQA